MQNGAALPMPDDDHERPDFSLRTDPSRLTTAQLLRELANLKEIFITRLDAYDRAIVLFQENITRVPTDNDKQIQHLQSLHEERFTGMDRAIQLLQKLDDHIPRTIDEKISALRFVHEEKFISIQVQFRERDVRTEQSSKDSKVAVDAALQAAKEAVGEQNKSSALAIAKSEASTVKQIDQMGLLITTQAKAVDDKFSDVKDRLTRIEGKDTGKVIADTTRQTADNYRQGASGNAISMASIAVAIIAILFGLFEAMSKH
jgi:hypothetical protein